MYTALLVNITPTYISNDTCQPVELTENEKLLNAFNGYDKYSFVEIYTPLMKITGKTYKEIDRKISEYSASAKTFDFQCIILR